MSRPEAHGRNRESHGRGEGRLSVARRRSYLDANRQNWNDRVTAHLTDGDYYDIEGFLAGRCTLEDIEADLLGDVSGKTLLHLMCHFGLDTLSWARRGAIVTGLDLSPKALEVARDLAAKTGLDARFVEADVNEAAAVLGETFEIVTACYGILAWLEDVDRFMKQVSACLAPGGTFVLADLHPVLTTLEPDDESGRFYIDDAYFSRTEPERVDSPRSYAGRDTTLEHTISYQWNHGLGEVIAACLNNGIALESVVEYPYLNVNLFPGHLRREGKGWVLANGPEIPMLFSIKGTKVECGDEGPARPGGNDGSSLGVPGD